MLKAAAYIQALVDSQYFDFTMKAQDEAGVRRAIDAGDVKAGVVIPPNFSNHLEQGDASVLILLDGSDSFSVQSGYSAASLVSQNYALRVSTQKTDRIGGKAVVIAQAASMPIKNSFQVLYNPRLPRFVVRFACHRWDALANDCGCSSRVGCCP